jgi:hypothetical protein
MSGKSDYMSTETALSRSQMPIVADVPCQKLTGRQNEVGGWYEVSHLRMTAIAMGGPGGAEDCATAAPKLSV